MTSAIANHSDTLVPLMRKAGFRYVFLGIENILEADLNFLRAAAKNEQRENGRKAGNATLKAIAALHRNRMFVVGGLIIGNPGDTRESIEANLEFARHYVDWPYIQHPTPYPRTPMTEDFKKRGLIIDRSSGRLRRHHGGGQNRSFDGRGDRISQVARGALDETTSPPFCFRSQPVVRVAPWRKDAGPYITRHDFRNSAWL